MADGAASGVAAISSSSSSVTLCSRVERTSRGAMSVTPVIGCLHPSPACDHLRRPLQHFPSCPQLLGYPPAADFAVLAIFATSRETLSRQWQ